MVEYQELNNKAAKEPDYLLARSLLRAIVNHYWIPSGIFFSLTVTTIISNAALIPITYFYGDYHLIFINLYLLLGSLVVSASFRLVVPFRAIYVVIGNIIPILSTNIVTFIKERDLSFIDGINYTLQLSSIGVLSLALYYSKEYYTRIIDESFIYFLAMMESEDMLRTKVKFAHNKGESIKSFYNIFLDFTKGYPYKPECITPRFYDFSVDKGAKDAVSAVKLNGDKDISPTSVKPITTTTQASPVSGTDYGKSPLSDPDEEEKKKDR